MEIKRIIVGPLRTNCYLLSDDGCLAIVDPGDEAPAIIDRIEKSGAVPIFIINTHGHFDHTGADNALKERYRIPLMVGQNEKNGTGFVPDVLLKNNSQVSVGGSVIKVLETPGHTPGGICLFGDGFVISGDTIFADGIGRTDLAGGSDSEMATSLGKLDFEIADGARVYPGHGDNFEYRKGMALEWLKYLK